MTLRPSLPANQESNFRRCPRRYNPFRCRTNGSRVWRPALVALERRCFAHRLRTPTHALRRAGWGDRKVCRCSREPVRQPRRQARHLVWR